MRRLIALFVSNAMILQSALAAPAVTTANVNFREGPGTGFSSFGTIPQGAQVELGDCDESGSWCGVTFEGRNGFVSGKFLQASEDETGWPRSYKTDSDATLILYQPQVSDWKDFSEIEAVVAAEYLKDEQSKPVFGVIDLSGRTHADAAADEVVIDQITVSALNFSALDRADLTDLTLQVGKILPTGAITMSQARLTASLAEYQRMNDVGGLNTEAPPIFVSNDPAILVQTDGEPVLAPVKGVTGLSFVVNTNWDLFRLDDGGALYLRDEKSWLTASGLDGSWEPAAILPDLLNKLPDDDNWADTREAMPAVAYEAGFVPKVIYSDKPAELILFDGEPKMEAVAGTGLEWAANTESDVFFLEETGTWYILVSGRWFKSASLEGPWAFTTPDLPDDFLNIPEDAPYYSVRSSVPNTSESAQARLKASIPHTARVEFGSVSAEVAYAGEPEFEAIDGTNLTYAVNTNDQIIRVGDKYYVLQDGIWFVGNGPNGPFVVAKAVPEEIYTIPPSSPVYNVTYVRVYETEPDAVWYGYTMGYLSGYLAWGTYVYGTGWYYRPWLRPALLPIFFPRPITYGIGAFYNPVLGVFGRYGYAYGPYRGIAGGGFYNARTGTYVRGRAVAGPLGTRGFVAAYNPRTGRGGFVAGGRNVYGSWRAGGVTGGAAWARTRGNAANATRWRATNGGARAATLGRRGDVFGGRDGQVYRRQGDKWQRQNGGRWTNVDRPSRETLQSGARDRAGNREGGPANRPNANRPNANRPNANRPNANKPAANRPANRPAGNKQANRPANKKPAAARPASGQRKQAPSHLSRDSSARQSGNRQVNRQRSSQPSRQPSRARSAPSRSHRGGGGRSRGGGGRRR